MTQVTALWRHPIKSHGREALQAVTLVAGQTMPWDRHWAVTHDATKHDGTDWSSCRNFMIGTRTPQLAGLWATLDPDRRRVTLRHGDLPDLTFCPDTDAATFIDWIAPLCATASVQPTDIVSAGDRGMTDSPFPSVSIMSTSSHLAVADQLGGTLEMERWRGNIWLDGLAPWAEMDWMDKHIQIGDATLAVVEPITRCMHTTANPVTGTRDADTLGVLKNTFGHQHFGVYARVVKGGAVSCGDTAKVL